MEKADIVVGSGPSGVAVAQALLQRGRAVVMLDGGSELEPPARARRDALAAVAPERWSAADRAAWQAPQFETPEGQVRRFGSDFAMAPAGAVFAPSHDFALRASHAVGGLSNLWGAAVLPYRQADMAGWPITADDLAPHYRAVAGFVPVSGRNDGLESLFPAFPMDAAVPLRASPQGERLLQRIDDRRAALNALGVHGGAARQAVDGGCRHCGMCLHGCPWGFIYSARRTVDQLRGRAGFEHRPGSMVRRFTEADDGVTVHLDSGETLPTGRLFLAAGVLETARILLASRPDTGTLRLKDSQHFFLPALHRWRSPHPVDRVPYHTLTQAFLEIDDPAVSPYLVHAQLYGWNAFYAREMMASYGRLLPGSAPLFRALARRLIAVQVFLHSDHSASVELRAAADGRLMSVTRPDPGTGPVMNAVKSKLVRALNLLGLTALGPAMRAAPVGSSFHVGGSVPMSADPGAAESDILGRPRGLSRVHLVDASVLPAIPATTITFSVMANAHRIGSVSP